MATDYVDQVANAIVRQLKAGTAPWQKPWQPGERFMPYNPTTGNEYRGMNALWLMSRAESQGFGDARWMTFRQAQEQDARVRKGEKGTPIQFWKWQGLEPVRDADGQPAVDPDGQPVRQMVRYERPRVWSAVVFNAAQIDGLPPAPERLALPAWERHERAETILTNAGVPIRHVPGDRAYYRLTEDTITLPARSQFASGDGYYATALHELGHATGHPSRLARDLAHPFGSEGYAREELRAEIASLMLGEQLGIGHDPGQHVAYVASWIKVLEQDPREVFRAAVDAEKITRVVRSFEHGREQLTGQASVPDVGHQTRSVRQDGMEQAPSVTELLTPLQYLTTQIETSAAANDGIHLLAQPVDWTAVLTETLGSDWAARAGTRTALQADLAKLAGPDFGRTTTVVAQDGALFAFSAANGNDMPLTELQRTVDRLRRENWAESQASSVLDPHMQAWLDRYDRRSETAIGRAMNALEERAEAAWDKFIDLMYGTSGAKPHTGDDVGLGTRLAAKIEHAYDKFLDYIEGRPANAGDALAAKAAAEQTTSRIGLVTRLVEGIVESCDRFLNLMSGHAPSVPDLPRWPSVDPVTPRQDQSSAPVAPGATRPPVMLQENHPAMAVNGERTYLAVPYAEKDDAKQLGAKWDRAEKAWYVPTGADLGAFAPWLPAKDTVHIAVEASPVEQFAAAIRASGLQLEGPPQMDGQLHRIPADGDKGRERSGAYTGYLDGRPAGFIQNHRTGVKQTWKATGQAASLSTQDRAQLAAEAAQKRHDRAREREQQAERIAQQVDAMWTAATPAQAHPYLAEKDVQAHGIRQDADGRLMLPLQDADGRIWSLQRIGKDGFKQFEEGGRVEGGHYVIGDVRQPGPLLIAEGFATAATLHEMTGMAAIVAFNAGNLLPVAQSYRQLFPDRIITIAGDDDWQRPLQRDSQGRPKINVGRAKAEEAAAAIGSQAVFPAFPPDSLGTDWNDLARLHGRSDGAGQFRQAMAIADREQAAHSLGTARDETYQGQERSLSGSVGRVLGRAGNAFSRDRDRAPVQEIGHER